ncbi:unnamed protein product [Prorocentrum cordatum]|uniref:Uncharacterized protein n=1 Tax=Prorocentrum cordatum TaxID=2364126 RepID=A0ABN9UG80_9DINO|nr:unnamed protein product [Polarella glacialis]
MAGIAGREVGGSSRRPPRRSCWLLPKPAPEFGPEAALPPQRHGPQLSTGGPEPAQPQTKAAACATRARRRRRRRRGGGGSETALGEGPLPSAPAEAGLAQGRERPAEQAAQRETPRRCPAAPTAALSHDFATGRGRWSSGPRSRDRRPATRDGAHGSVGPRREKSMPLEGWGRIKDTCIIEETVAPAGPPTPQLDWLQTKLSESRKAPAKIKLSSLWNQEVSTKVARTPSMSRKLKTEVPPSARGAALELAEVPTAPSTVHHRPAQASHDARKVTAP